MPKLRNLKAEMIRSGITNIELAGAVGVTPTTVSDWLNCHTAPSMAKAFRVAKILDQPVDYLFVRFDER